MARIAHDSGRCMHRPAPDWAASATPVAVHTDFLKRRYANGEMDRDEYLKRLSYLSDA